MTYNEIFAQERDSALKARQIDALIQHQRATEAYNEQMARHASYLDTMREQQALQGDQSANLLMNTYNPPSAMAVPRDPNNPDDVAWARNANGQRTRYLQSNRLQPGPAQPYTGGAKEMPQARALMPKVDAVGARQEDRQVFQEQTKLRGETDKMKGLLSQYLPADVDSIEGLDAYNPKTGEHDYRGPDAKINYVAGGKSGVFAAPTPPAGSAAKVPSVESLMQQYRDYKAKKAQLGGMAQPATPSLSVPSQIPAGPAPSAQGLQPGAKVRQGGKVYLIQADGSPAEIQ